MSYQTFLIISLVSVLGLLCVAGWNNRRLTNRTLSYLEFVEALIRSIQDELHTKSRINVALADRIKASECKAAHQTARLNELEDLVQLLNGDESQDRFPEVVTNGCNQLNITDYDPTIVTAPTSDVQQASAALWHNAAMPQTYAQAEQVSQEIDAWLRWAHDQMPDAESEAGFRKVFFEQLWLAGYKVVTLPDVSMLSPTESELERTQPMGQVTNGHQG